MFGPLVRVLVAFRSISHVYIRVQILSLHAGYCWWNPIQKPILFVESIHAVISGMACLRQIIFGTIGFNELVGAPQVMVDCPLLVVLRHGPLPTASLDRVVYFDGLKHDLLIFCQLYLADAGGVLLHFLIK